MRKELRLELADQFLGEVDLAQWAIPLVSAPGQNAIAMEKMANVARQSNDFLPNLKPLHAERALITPLERDAVKGGLVEAKHGHLTLLIELFLHFFALFSFPLDGSEGFKFNLSHRSLSFFCLACFLLFKLLLGPH